MENFTKDFPLYRWQQCLENSRHTCWVTEWPFIHLLVPWSWPHHRALYELLFSSLENWNEVILLLITILSPWFTQPAGTSYLPGFEDQSLGRGYTLSFYCFISSIGFSSLALPLDHRRIIEQRGYWQKMDTFDVNRGKSWLANKSLILKNTVKSRGFSSYWIWFFIGLYQNIQVQNHEQSMNCLVIFYPTSKDLIEIWYQKIDKLGLRASPGNSITFLPSRRWRIGDLKQGVCRRWLINYKKNGIPDFRKLL